MLIEHKPANPLFYIGIVVGLAGLVYALVKDEISDGKKVSSLEAKITGLEDQLKGVPTIYDDTEQKSGEPLEAGN